MKNKLKVEFTPKERKIALGKELEIRVEIPKEVGKVENLKVPVSYTHLRAHET